MFPVRDAADTRYYQRKREERNAETAEGLAELQEAIAVYKAAAGDKPYMVPDPKFCFATSNGWILGNRENGYIASYMKKIIFRSPGHARTYLRHLQAMSRIEQIIVDEIKPHPCTLPREYLRKFEPETSRSTMRAPVSGTNRRKRHNPRACGN